MRMQFSEIEKRVYTLIVKSGSKGVLQRELTTLLGIDSRKGSRVAKSLEKKGLIIRKPVLYKGRWTYQLIAKKKVVAIPKGAIYDCPCFLCKFIDKCAPGLERSPTKCNMLTEWLLSLDD
ncbi:MAG TPA: Lrp/AsnC family transcriptional regulator [Candidatus Bathyarchaeota archaeon]|nr:Lrp/AsnC family transcriptional regulator [Candidatus Bathyarchaeota archaeon]